MRGVQCLPSTSGLGLGARTFKILGQRRVFEYDVFHVVGVLLLPHVMLRTCGASTGAGGKRFEGLR